MKKISYFLSTLAVVAATGLLSSCFSDPYVGMTEDALVNPDVNSSSDAVYTVTVRTNVAGAKFTYNNATVASTFNPTANGTLVVSKDGYVSQNINITLGDNRNIVLDVTLIETPTSNLQVQDANKAGTDNTVANSSTNQSQYGEATISIPANTGIEGVEGTENLGIGVYHVTGTATSEPAAGQSADAAVIAAVCEPTGATFNPDVTITVNAENASGLSFVCQNGGESVPVDVNANSLEAKVGHFSTWNFVLKATISSVSTETVSLFDGNILVKEGNNEVSYQANTGFTSSRTGIVESYLLSQFGSKAGKVTKVGNVQSTGVGSAHIRITQEKKIVKYRSNSVEFTATVYGAVKIEVVSVTYDTSGHSGGQGGN